MPDQISVEDRFAIEDLLNRLCWALDTGDAEGVVSCFTPDGVMVQGGGQRFEKTEGLRKFAERATEPAGAKGRQHIVKPLFFIRSGDGWTMRSYLTILHCD